MSDIKAFDNDVDIAWCPGCGNFPILGAVKQALAGLDLLPHQVLICTGIGQAPKLPHYMQVNTFNGLHGREVAVAVAAKLAAPDLTVLVHAGDGGAYAEGGNHFLHAIRRNIDITLVVHDNHYFALTKAQASPTTSQGVVTRFNPEGVAAMPLNPLALAISQSCAFVGQATSARPDHLADLLMKAIAHKGFSFINVLQPCVSWDHVRTYEYYRERCYEPGSDYDASDRLKAMELVTRAEERYPVGVIYTQQRPEYSDQTTSHVTLPLRRREVNPDAAVSLFSRFQ
ncbi:MAG: thiamine pyrophosphate-dependent enzyme [Desulfobacterales bacterium]|nr:thiamine pyrophosphate-dependent enzyme [Desulfobacterales bacterium]MDD4072465.1 thiamine pyrophosphate-dependent enzyme [Desulfobacterales bacterium]MDD4393163.1 thiamine pyrophosphate-dependent enzyme [Desulfobacterales bacterium]